MIGHINLVDHIKDEEMRRKRMKAFFSSLWIFYAIRRNCDVLPLYYCKITENDVNIMFMFRVQNAFGASRHEKHTHTLACVLRCFSVNHVFKMLYPSFIVILN